MRSILFSFLCLASLDSLHAQEKLIIKYANAQERNVSGYNRIEVGGAIDLYLSPGERETVVVSAADPSVRDRILTRVTNGKLEIRYDTKTKGISWTSNVKLKAYVSFRTLTGIQASGASDVFVNGIIRADRLDIGISGASDFKGAVMVKELVLSQSGASDAEISGEAVKFRADISGACNLKAYGLTAETAEISASGASNARVNVTRQLDAKASGASDLYYKGAPANTNFDSKGASSVRKVER
jgi:hypothetical protein